MSDRIQVTLEVLTAGLSSDLMRASIDASMANTAIANNDREYAMGRLLAIEQRVKDAQASFSTIMALQRYSATAHQKSE